MSKTGSGSGNTGSKRRRPLTPTSPVYSTPDSPQLLPSIEKVIESQMGKLNERFNERFTRLEVNLAQHAENIEKRLKDFSEALKFQAEETEHLKRKEIPRLESEIIEEQLKREREIDRLSSYICRENIVIMGIPEKSEKEDTEKVVKEFYKVNLGLTDEQIGSIEHQRVHRVPATARPRPIKARFLRYSDKIMIQSNSAKLKGSSYFIMDDLPKRVRDERRLQIPALKAARNEGKLAFFSRAEPWKLFVNGKFLSRDEQKKFVEMAGKRRPNPKTSDNAMEVAEGSQRDLQSVGTGEDLVGAVGGV